MLLALDPVHIGAGGIRLSRVDMAIAREPGTRLPKIPGTSLSGVARSYAAIRFGKPGCAGQGGHCQEADCPVCHAFGSARDSGGTQTGSAGTVNLFDAHVLLVPVATAVGPVWVTTKDRLEEAGFGATSAPTGDEVLCTTPQDNSALKALNLGWLLLRAEYGAQVTLPEGVTPPDGWDAIANRIGLVSEKVFPQIVNSNLEVRTSVSIDPTTGAAEDKALFTYEAIPRATWLVADLIQDDYRGSFTPKPTSDGGVTAAKPLDVALAGLRLAEWLGVGGMGTRGFGRIRLARDWTVKSL